MAVVVSDGALVAMHRPWSPSPQAGLTWYSGLVEDYATIYKTQPNVRLCVRFLGRNIAQLNLKAYRRISDVEREQLSAHPVSAVIRRPNPRTTRHRFIRAIVEDRAIFDNAFVLKARNPASGALRLFRLPPQLMRPVGDDWLYPDEWEFMGNRQRKTFSADTIIHLLGHNPSDTRVGTSPIESIRRILAEDVSAGEWREQFWRNSARMSGVLKRPLEAPKWSDPARERFKADWNSTWTGAGASSGGTPILEEGMDFEKATFSAEDSQYLGARRLSREEVAAEFFIPPVFVGILEHANFANVKEQHRSLYQDTLGPWLDELEEDLELQLLPEFDDVEDVYLQFNIDEKLRGSFEEEVQSLQVAVGAPHMTRNEARARRNLPPVEGGDALVTPLNVLVGGQASARDSAPPPAGTLARPAGGQRRRGFKSADELPSDVAGWVDQHVEVLGGFFDRQGSSVRSRLGAGQDLEAAWGDRWDSELADLLSGLGVTMTAEVAGAVAAQFGGTYDESLAMAWLLEHARIVAEETNSTTRAQVVEALDGDDPAAAVAAVFALAAGARAGELAVTEVTAVGNFARHEGAAQAGAGTKIWRVNSSSSRHPHLNGQAVPMDGRFSNGARWPGDSVLSLSERAGCVCSLDFAAEAPE